MFLPVADCRSAFAPVGCDEDYSARGGGGVEVQDSGDSSLHGFYEGGVAGIVHEGHRAATMADGEDGGARHRGVVGGRGLVERAEGEVEGGLLE